MKLSAVDPHKAGTLGEVLGRFDPAGAGEEMMDLMARLYPMPRSITGQGFRDTQAVIAEILPGLNVESVSSGSEAFDWVVPDEWNIRSAHLKGPDETTLVDFADHPLHVLNYSLGVDATMTLEELRPHLYSDPDQPDAIPYRTSYYEDAWGFCLSDNLLQSLPDGDYQVYIDADKSKGVLNYGEFYVEGESDEEVVLTAHACHPGQCNDNLSGVVVLTAAARIIQEVATRRSYRFLYLPGGIGSVVWLSRNKDRTDRIVAGMALSCLGDTAPLRFKETYSGDTAIDKAAALALRDGGWEHDIGAFEPYGFDERNFNSPGFRLPVGSLTRSPHGGYSGYHTSRDDLDSMSPEHLGVSLQALLNILHVIDGDRHYVNLSPYGEPQLGKRGLYASIGGLKDRRELELALLWVMNLCDGSNSLVDVAARSGIEFRVVAQAAHLLLEAGLLGESEQPR